MDKDLTRKNYTFFNQDSVGVIFPDIIKGKVTVIGFIYTNCPDICPMTTHNMYLTQQKLKKNAIENVLFVTVTFDPDRDFPSVLKKFGEIRDIDFTNWVFLWGDKKNTKSLLKRFDITALKTDSTYFDDGELTYSVMHTDRISLIDNESRLKKNYRGSKVNLEELYNDIINLGE
ncbi:MAG: SCO family protein [Bacteroidetes bacterium]|nr:SCO family protein [Bacteroidota bacterium]MCH8034122.1 SCO family protein [Bacteroidota bacterium]